MTTFHPFHIIKELCQKNSIDISMMPNSNANHTSFKMTITAPFSFQGHQNRTKLTAHGTLFGTTVCLGISTTHRREFDLYDPSSISDIHEYIQSGKMWAR